MEALTKSTGKLIVSSVLGHMSFIFVREVDPACLFCGQWPRRKVKIFSTRRDRVVSLLIVTRTIRMQGQSQSDFNQNEIYMYGEPGSDLWRLS